MGDKYRDFFKVAVFEREEHKTTLTLLAKFLERTRARGANGMWATTFCQLCARLGPQGRADCLHVTAPERVQRELARLERSLRLHEPIPESYTDKPAQDEGP
jgi:hypothetical protein